MASDGQATLSALAGLIAGGGVKVVDLTQPLEPKTPVLALPPQFGQSPPFEIEVISEYDERGPAWYWNKVRMGEHTGTHFDAPIHWISGKDFPNNATDTIPVEMFIGPACVIDAAAEAAADPDFLVTPAFIEAWEARHGRIPARSMTSRPVSESLGASRIGVSAAPGHSTVTLMPSAAPSARSDWLSPTTPNLLAA